jgi:hypothetical protein
MKYGVSRSRDGMAFSRSYLAKRMELDRASCSEELAPDV